ncbi:MAG: hypothetical protein WD601_14370, partial [Pseudohongiellaceae bacterium]
MSTHFTPLPLNKLSGQIGYHQPHQLLPDHLTLEMPAIYAMTDLQRVAAERVCYAVHDWSPQTGLRSAEI